jgi:two-component system, LytTR family, sensor kinase
MEHSVFIQFLLILISTVLLGLAIMLLSIYKRLFLGIRNIWLRRNLVVLSIAVLFMSALLAFQSPEILASNNKQSLIGLILKQLGQIVLIVLFVFNTVWFISRVPGVSRMSFIKHHIVIVLSIVVSTVLIYTIIYFVDQGMDFKKLHATLTFAYLNAVITGLIYTAVNYVELDRKRKLNEKELEVTRLMALKTKAELDALHSKVNPHFLYNALNSIADLSITDGKKARKMTVALADLFRYSINYSSNNYSTIKEEVEMAEVYLVIEKIRFEDQLNCTIKVDEELKHYLVPRFILQPLIENAVKHGLKATGQMTEIELEIKRNESGFIIIVADNGPAFPDEMNPGYGVKSVYDKLELLFPGNFELKFSNIPRKQVSIQIQKMIKNEPGI